MNKIVKELRKLLGNGCVQENVNLKKYNTFRVEYCAKLFIKINTCNNLVKVLKFLEQKKLKYVIIGGGSNILFKSFLIKRVVIYLTDGYNRIYEKNGLVYINAFAGTRISNIIRHCKKNNYACLEWAVGIPASVGGAVVSNLGAFNNEISNYVESVTYYYEGKLRTIKNLGNLMFQYRSSIFKKNGGVVCAVTLRLKQIESESLKKIIMETLSKKKAVQPLNYPSCGSVFKNGKNYSVAKLIDLCNLKGTSIGGAEISTKHSNFIVNTGNATSKDILSLIALMKKIVFDEFKIRIHEEVDIK